MSDRSVAQHDNAATTALPVGNTLVTPCKYLQHVAAGSIVYCDDTLVAYALHTLCTKCVPGYHHALVSHPEQLPRLGR